jgi:PAS domain S-box-containing protein
LFRESISKSIFDTSPDGIVIITLDGMIFDANKSFQDMLGYTLNEFKNLNFQELTPSKWHEIEAEAIRNFMSVGHGTFEKEYIRKDGKVIPVSLSGWLIKDPQENPVYIGAFVKDITEQKRTKEVLEESEELFRMITEQNLMGINLIQDNKIIYTNQAQADIDEYSIQEGLSWKADEWKKAIHPDDLPFVMEQSQKKQRGDATGIVTSYSYRVITKSQKIKWVDLYSKTVSYKGKPAVMVGQVDITPRKKAEDALKESEQLFRMVAEQNLMSISIVQGNVFVYSNQANAELFGYSIQEILNWEPKEYAKIIHPEDRSFVMEQSQKKQRGDTEGVVTHYQYRLITKSQKIKWIDLVSKTVIYKGTPAVLITQVDITELKKVIQDLEESEQKYRLAYNQANLYRDLFSHDISNIFQSIQSSIDLLSLSQKQNEDKVDIVLITQLIADQIKRGARLVSNVRKLSEIEKVEMELKPINVYEVLEKAVDNIVKSYGNKKFDIKLDFGEKQHRVNANEFLYDIFEIILRNSMKYNSNPVIEIEVKFSKQQTEGITNLKLEFIDNGIGVIDDMKETIFQRVFQEDQSVTGIGLGLSVVRKILQYYNGHIWVEDKVKGDYTKGSNFIIIIPELEIVS